MCTIYLYRVEECCHWVRVELVLVEHKIIYYLVHRYFVLLLLKLSSFQIDWFFKIYCSQHLSMWSYWSHFQSPWIFNLDEICVNFLVSNLLAPCMTNEIIVRSDMHLFSTFLWRITRSFFVILLHDRVTRVFLLFLCLIFVFCQRALAAREKKRGTQRKIFLLLFGHNMLYGLWVLFSIRYRLTPSCRR